MTTRVAVTLVLVAALCSAILAPRVVDAGKAPFYVPTKEERLAADYGPFPDDWKDLIVAYMERAHHIPRTARYVMVSEPGKGTNWAKTREKVIYCYNVSVQINPDHSWNGFTLWTLFIRDGKIIGDYKT